LQKRNAENATQEQTQHWNFWNFLKIGQFCWNVCLGEVAEQQETANVMLHNYTFGRKQNKIIRSKSRSGGLMIFWSEMSLRQSTNLWFPLVQIKLTIFTRLVTLT